MRANHRFDDLTAFKIRRVREAHRLNPDLNYSLLGQRFNLNEDQVSRALNKDVKGFSVEAPRG